MSTGVKICPKCGLRTMRISVQLEEDGFVEVWRCLNYIDSACKKICGYTIPIEVEIKNGRLLRR